RETRRSQTDYQDFVTSRFARIWPSDIQRIPASQQTVNFKSPRQFQDVFQAARLNLRNVHGILLLKNAGFHTVIADSMSGTGGHRIVDGHYCQRADWITVAFYGIHLGDLFVKRATR